MNHLLVSKKLRNPVNILDAYARSTVPEEEHKEPNELENDVNTEKPGEEDVTDQKISPDTELTTTGRYEPKEVQSEEITQESAEEVDAATNLKDALARFFEKYKVVEEGDESAADQLTRQGVGTDLLAELILGATKILYAQNYSPTEGDTTHD